MKPLMKVGRMLPIDYEGAVSDATYPMASRQKVCVLSMPFRPYVSTRLLAL